MRNPVINYPKPRVRAKKLKEEHYQPKKPEPPESPPPGSPTTSEVVFREKLIAIAESVSSKRREWERVSGDRVLEVYSSREPSLRSSREH